MFRFYELVPSTELTHSSALKRKAQWFLYEAFSKYVLLQSYHNRSVGVSQAQHSASLKRLKESVRAGKSIETTYAEQIVSAIEDRVPKHDASAVQTVSDIRSLLSNFKVVMTKGEKVDFSSLYTYISQGSVPSRTTICFD